LLNRADIARRIPHQGRMCLLDTVIHWTPAELVAQTLTHLDLENPLRSGGVLGAAHGIEYAAQAMAVHGVLMAEGAVGPRQGYLASVRGVRLLVSRLDHQDGPLQVRVERLSGNPQNILYRFELTAKGQTLLDGRAAVVIDATPTSGQGVDT
jgi:predicted hotdog family 3-hydroxylacyl-ACP dehydratase